MSNSRLEKFIYAICSMEVSDLPAPLSRIEILWNCLITGETPDFEPQSRNEKYLMAMLGLYELDQLPTPMSRGEKLLYKIAMGETDLSDIPGYLSRYEELLKYLIENGGISGGDFEYVLYTLNQSLSTLYQTVEKPVKSAILTGQTLVNLLKVNKDNYIFNQPQNWSIEDGYFKCVSTTSWHTVTDRFNNMIKPSTKYLIVVEIKENTLNIDVKFDGYETALNSFTAYLSFNSNEVGIKKVVITTPSTIDSTKNGLFRMPINVPNEGSILKFRVMAIEYQEGMENWDIPYFEGMQSVKLPVLTTVGKNLFDGGIERGGFSNGVPIPPEKGWQEYIRSKNFTKVNSLDFYTSINTGLVTNINMVRIHCYDENYEYISAKAITEQKPTNTKYIKITAQTLNNPADLSLNYNIQIEEGSVATSYEPYKTNILSCNEEVELRGIGDVQDTLDLMTGELTQRIGLGLIDGSVGGELPYGNGDPRNGTICLEFHKNSPIYMDGALKNSSTPYISQQLPYRVGIDADYCYIAKYYAISSSAIVRVPGNAPQEALDWLKNNPITFIYELETPVIKTVDLTTVDQDGQPTKLKTFNDITYVEINADPIIPSVNVEVATKISETLSTLGLDHHDISNTQNELGQTIEEQAENTDATMMATTEIYEQIL